MKTRTELWLSVAVWLVQSLILMIAIYRIAMSEEHGDEP